MRKGVNALRCVLAGGFENTWYLVASVYYAAKQFNQEQLIVNQLNNVYPYLCSCTLEVNEYAGWFGSGSQAAAADFNFCSEAAAAAAAAAQAS